MKDIPVEPGSKISAPNATCRLVVPKAKLHDMTVDKPCTFQVSGTVKSMHPMYEDEDQYEIEIASPLVEKMESKETDKKDEKKEKEDPKESMANMPREKLKERIKKAMEDEDEEKTDGK